ncbi:MAG: hypothetical protein LZF62_240118 [Nitrospira sp.]|nr:MAG: hypothetical protein LZF62_240118 [Nitrospira sp.]
MVGYRRPGVSTNTLARLRTPVPNPNTSHDSVTTNLVTFFRFESYLPYGSGTAPSGGGLGLSRKCMILNQSCSSSG